MAFVKFLTLASSLTGALAAIPSKNGYAVTWSDDFTGTAGSPANSANWQYMTPATKYVCVHLMHVYLDY